MIRHPQTGPQHTRFYRLVAFFTKLQLQYLHHDPRNRKIFSILHLIFSGVTALTTITIMAYLTKLMLLFPPLGPSAFILFHTPLSESASPRHLIMSHTLAVFCGLGALALTQICFPDFREAASAAMNWPSVIAIALSMGSISIAMVGLKCVHPPAAATALIAAMGYLEGPVQAGGVIVAVLFLVLEAIFFNRLLGGLPYPLWRFDPRVQKTHRFLTGSPETASSRWEALKEKTFHRR